MVREFDREFNIGGYGIDTELEREIIDYRPHIKYTKGTEFLPLRSAGMAPEQDMREIVDGPSIIDTWEEVQKVVKKADEIEKKLSDKLIDVSVPVPEKMLPRVQESASEFGFNIEGQIPFELYRKTFEFPDYPGSSLIQDIFEDYQADVDGNLNAELYIDVIDIQKDLAEIVDFSKKGLVAQILPDFEGDLSPSVLERIHQNEKELIEQYAETLKKNKEIEDIYSDLVMYEYGTDRCYQAEKELDEGKRKAFILEKRLFSHKEVVDLLKRKASDIDEYLSLIENYIDYDPFKEDRFEVLYHISKQFDGKEKMTKEMRGLQAVLKFAIDAKKNRANEMKHQLRGLAGSKNRRKIHQTLINSIHFRRQVLTNIYDWLANFDGVPDNAMFDLVAQHISQGVRQAEDKYRKDISDFYKMHAMIANLRLEKLSVVLDKDISRQTYRLFGNMVSHIQNNNVPRPNDEEFGKWLREIIQKNH